MAELLIGLLGQTFGLLFGAIRGSISMITGLIKSGFNEMFKYHQEAIAFARTAGLSARQADAQTSVLTRRTKDLAMAYGITSKEVLELQKNIAAATGKAYLLNDREAERQIQINKLVGSEVSNQFASEMMQHMGGQLSAVQGAVSKAYATAAKSGLNAAQFSEKVAKNLSLANKLSFREGVNGIIKMVALSEKLGFNLQAVEAAANNFMELDKAIENSARLQMLGGSAGAYGSNPLAMAYEANYDPEAFTERMTDMLKGLARFDRKQGVAVVNGMNRDLVKSIAQGMGIGFEEAMTIAKKQSEMSYKKEAYGATLGNFTQEQQDFILNKSYVDPNTGALMINDSKGQAYDISNGGLSSSILEDMMQYNGMSDTDLLTEQARSLTSIQEMIAGRKESVLATIAEKAKEYLPLIQKLVDFVTDKLFTTILPKTLGVMENVGSWVMEHKGAIKGAVEGILSVLGFIFNQTANYFKTIIAIMIGWKIAKWAGRLPWKGGTVGSAIRGKILGGGRTGGGGSPAALAKNGVLSKTTFKPSTGILSSVRDYGRYVGSNYSALRESGKGRLSAFWKAVKGPKVGSNGGITNALGKNMGRMNSNSASSTFAKNAIKGAKRVKTGIGIGLAGTALNFVTDKGLESGAIKAGGGAHTLGKVGGTALEYAGLGSMFGPWGTAIGAGVGIAKGYYDVYQEWKKLPENANKNMLDLLKEQFGSGQKIGNFIKDGFTGIFKGYQGTINSIHKVTDGFTSKVIKFFGFKTAKKTDYNYDESSSNSFASGGIVGGTSYTGDKVTANVNSGEMVLTREQQSNLFRFIDKLPSYLEASKAKPNNSVWQTFINSTQQVSEAKSEASKPIYLEVVNAKSAQQPINSVMSQVSQPSVINSTVTTKPEQPNWQSIINILTQYGKFAAERSGSTYINVPRLESSLQPINGIIPQLDQTSAKSNTSVSGINPERLVTQSITNVLPQSSQLGSKGGTPITTVNPEQLVKQPIASVLTQSNDVQAKPVGEKEYIYKPISSESHISSNSSTVTVKDMNINIGGTIKLDGGSGSKDIDINSLLNNVQFVNQIKDIIKMSINNDMNGGRFMNDVSVMRGSTTNQTLYGKR